MSENKHCCYIPERAIFNTISHTHLAAEELEDKRLALAALSFGSVAAVKFDGGVCLLFTRDHGVDINELLGTYEKKIHA